MEIVKTVMAARTAAEQSSGRDKPPRRRSLGVGLLVGACLLFGGWIWWSDRREKNAMFEIEDQIAKGRYPAACRNLEALLERKADVNGELRYLLGWCELARGHIEASEKTWASVEPGTEFSERAILGRMRLWQENGRLAMAERLVSEAARDERNNRTSLMVGLVPILIDLGRQDEATELIEDRWEYLNALGQGALDPAIKLLLRHVEVTTGEAAIDVVRDLTGRGREARPRR